MTLTRRLIRVSPLHKSSVILKAPRAIFKCQKPSSEMHTLRASCILVAVRFIAALRTTFMRNCTKNRICVSPLTVSSLKMRYINERQCRDHHSSSSGSNTSINGNMKLVSGLICCVCNATTRNFRRGKLLTLQVLQVFCSFR